MMITQLINNNIGAFIYKNQNGESVTVVGKSVYKPLLITLKPSKYNNQCTKYCVPIPCEEIYQLRLNKIEDAKYLYIKHYQQRRRSSIKLKPRGKPRGKPRSKPRGKSRKVRFEECDYDWKMTMN